MHSELPIKHWVVCDPPRDKVGCTATIHHQREVYMCDQAGTGPEGMLHDEVAQMPGVPTPTTLPSLSQAASMTLWGDPYNQLTEEEKTQVSVADSSV